MPRGKNARRLTSEVVRAALRKHGGNVSAAARELKVYRSTIRHHRKRLIAAGSFEGGVGVTICAA
jgi:ActR/RegA family two-component response regulator